jgi:hypothetical protein
MQRLRINHAADQGASMRELLNMLSEVHELRHAPQEDSQEAGEEHKTSNNAELGLTQPSEDETDSDQEHSG